MPCRGRGCAEKRERKEVTRGNILFYRYNVQMLFCGWGFVMTFEIHTCIHNMLYIHSILDLVGTGSYVLHVDRSILCTVVANFRPRVN